MASKPKSTSLLEQAKSIVRPNSDWLDKLPANQRADVTELLLAKIDGRISLGREAIIKLLEFNGIKTSETGLRRAILKLRNSK